MAFYRIATAPDTDLAAFRPDVRLRITEAIAARMERELREQIVAVEPEIAGMIDFCSNNPELGVDHSVENIVKTTRPLFNTEVTLADSV